KVCQGRGESRSVGGAGPEERGVAAGRAGAAPGGAAGDAASLAEGRVGAGAKVAGAGRLVGDLGIGRRAAPAGPIAAGSAKTPEPGDSGGIEDAVVTEAKKLNQSLRGTERECPFAVPVIGFSLRGQYGWETDLVLAKE